MTAGFTLSLDTTAPEVTWGAVDGAVASEEMAVEYLLSEPGVDHAEAELRDGRVLPMTVQATRLVVTLPDDAPEGLATIRLYVVDDVLNGAARTLAVSISGVIPVEPAPTGRGGLPRVRPRVVRSEPSRAATASTYEVRARVVTTSALRVRSRYVAPTQRTIRWRSVGYLDSATALVGHARSMPSVVDLNSATTVSRRAEGPRAEEEILLLLDLL